MIGFRAAHLVAHPPHEAATLLRGLGFRGRGGEELEASQRIADLVGDLGQHEPELLVPFLHALPHPFHGSAKPAQLLAPLRRNRHVHAPPLDAERHPAEPLQRLHHPRRQQGGQQGGQQRREGGTRRGCACLKRSSGDR